MPIGRFDEYRYYRFCASLGIRNLLQNGPALGWKKTLGKISQPINSYTRFPEYWYFEKEIRRHAEAGAGAGRLKILDVGSPKALGLYLAVHYPAEIHLTDITPLNLDEYKLLWEVVRSQALGHVVFSLQDARALEYGDATFDVAYAMSVIEHVEGQAGDTAGIRELMRVLRPGGRLVVSVPFGRTYVEQSRFGLAGAARRTTDQTPHFFQRIYDEPTSRARLIDGATGLADVTCTTVWREHAVVARALGSVGENVRGLLGWMNPLVSMLVNRSGQGICSGGTDRYGQVSTERDIYGDLMFSGTKA